jgi:hypothetical protein
MAARQIPNLKDRVRFLTPLPPIIGLLYIELEKEGPLKNFEGGFTNKPISRGVGP